MMSHLKSSHVGATGWRGCSGSAEAPVGLRDTCGGFLEARCAPATQPFFMGSPSPTFKHGHVDDSMTVALKSARKYRDRFTRGDSSVPQPSVVLLHRGDRPATRGSAVGCW